MSVQKVLDFWFNEQHQAFWFSKDDDFDLKIRENFTELHQQATLGELWQWRDSAEGRLAEVIVLDQFSRNLYRNDAKAFAFDSMALVLAQELIHLGLDKILSHQQRHFAYLPFMHSESLLIHQQAIVLFKSLPNPQALDFEYKHLEIIQRFGRYPHRNQVLSRTSTAEEIEF